MLFNGCHDARRGCCDAEEHARGCAFMAVMAYVGDTDDMEDAYLRQMIDDNEKVVDAQIDLQREQRVMPQHDVDASDDVVVVVRKARGALVPVFFAMQSSLTLLADVQLLAVEGVALSSDGTEVDSHGIASKRSGIAN